MELKLESGQDVSEEATGSNRTFMELKSASKATETAAFVVLIVPLWN